MLGSYGLFCVCSFNAIKLLSTGEGGMLLCRDQDWLERIKVVSGRALGHKPLNLRFPMSDLQATLGLSQLGRYYGSFLERRKQLADIYFNELRPLPVALPEVVRDKSIFFRFPLRKVAMDFDQIRAAFDAEGIEVRRGVDAMLHRIVGLDRTNFRVAEKLYGETLSIPIYPALTDSMAATVVQGCLRILR
jgi:UDP-4-amino-4-deoxy-L-arabinose-oxoglutarate aminotransferase